MFACTAMEIALEVWLMLVIVKKYLYLYYMTVLCIRIYRNIEAVTRYLKDLVCFKCKADTLHLPEMAFTTKSKPHQVALDESDLRT